MDTRTLHWLVLPLIVALFSPPGAIAETLDSLREKITNTLSTIGSVEIRYHSPPIDMSLPIFANSPRPEPLRPLETKVEHWAKQGSREYYELFPWHEPSSVGVFRHLCSFDGRQFFHFSFIEDKTKIVGGEAPLMIGSVRVRDKPQYEEFVQRVVPARLLGFHVWESQLTMLELLKRPKVTYVGEEDVDGQICHCINFGEYEGFTPYRYKMTVWFDPQHEFLPKKIEASPVADIPLVIRSVVQEFFEVDDPLLRRKRWFPKKAVCGAAIFYVMDDVKLNHQIPQSTFQPVIPDGTRVEYFDQRVALPGTNRTNIRVVTWGGAQGQAIAKKRFDELAGTRQKEVIQKNQAKFESHRKRQWLIGSSLLIPLVVVAVIVWKRSRQRYQ